MCVNRKGPVRYGLVASLVIALLLAGVPGVARAGGGLEVGAPMPAVTVADWDGRPVQLRPAPGRALYVVFWAWDSTHRRAELMALDALDEEYRALGVDIVAVHDGEWHDRAAVWFRRMAFSFPSYWDTTGFFRTLGDVNLARVGIDADGRVRVLSRGFTLYATPALMGLRTNLNRLLSVPAPEDTRGLPPGLPAVGAPLPEFALPDFEGKTFRTSSLKGHKAACYVFWASGCGFARSALLRLQALYPEFYARGVEFVSINVWDRLPWARDWLRSNPLPFVNLRDEFSLVSDRFGVWGVPVLVVADKSGLVTFSGSGDDVHGADLRQLLEAVAEPAEPGPAGPDDPLRNLRPLVEVAGDFDGLSVYADPLLGPDRTSTLARGLRECLDSLYAALGIDRLVFTGSDSSLTLYADPMRYFADSGAPCMSLGYAVCSLTPRPQVRLYVLWTVDADTTLAVMRHELVHGLLKLASGTVPPKWFDEGLADSLMSARPPDYFTVSRLREGPDRPGPDDLCRMFNEDSNASIARAVSHAAVLYILHTHGATGIAAVIDALAGGSAFPEAIQLGLGVSVDRLWEDFWADAPAAGERAARVSERPQGFPDVPPGAAGYSEIGTLVELGAVNGFPDGSFRPDALVTRAEFAKMAALTLGILQNTALPAGYDDAASVPLWSLPYVSACLRDGIIRGDHGLIRPSDTITRAEAVVMIVRALGLTPQEGELDFSDASAIPSWAAASVWEAACQGVIDCGGGVKFEPQKPVTRRQAAIWLSRAYWLRASMAVPALLGWGG
jgi:peroxiredoxin